MSSHIMIDIETLGTGSYAPICSVGLVSFESDASNFQDSLIKVKSIIVNWQSCIDIGAQYDSGAIRFWLNECSRNASAIDHVFDRKSAVLWVDAYVSILEFIRDTTSLNGKVRGIWGNGSEFDNVVIQNMCKLAGLRPPWPGGLNRCYRTVHRMFANKTPELSRFRRRIPKHIAINDALNQAESLFVMNKKHSFLG